MGEKYINGDGRVLDNWHDGTTRGGKEPEAARPTPPPTLTPISDPLAGSEIPAVVLPNELAWLHADVRDRLLHGAELAGSALPAKIDPVDLMSAFADQITTAVAARPDAMIWVYLDLDSHIHAHGFDQRAAAAMTALDELARRLRDGGTSVLVFSDHGLARSAPRPETTPAWEAAARARWSPLPPGGAGRVRWLYPRPEHADRLTDLLARQLAH